MKERIDGTGRTGFTELAREHYDAVYRFLVNQAPTRPDAADLTQETFVRAQKAFGRFDGSRPFAPWIYKIARHVVADFYRRHRGAEELEEGAHTDPRPDPREEADTAEARARIWQLARQLKPRHHQVLLLFYREELSIEETAQAMALTRVHVKVLLHRARAQLKALLADEMNLQEVVYEDTDR